MRYRVHHLDVKRSDMQERLEKFLNELRGEVISIVPSVKPSFQGGGMIAKIDTLLIVEKVH